MADMFNEYSLKLKKMDNASMIEAKAQAAVNTNQKQG